MAQTRPRSATAFLPPPRVRAFRPVPWPARRHATNQRGLSLIELLIIIAVIATLATIALLFFSDVTEQTRVARAIADITTIGGEIDTFEYMNDRLPNDLAEIGRASFKDPWGNVYVYQAFASTPQGRWRKDHNLVPINSSFDF